MTGNLSEVVLNLIAISNRHGNHEGLPAGYHEALAKFWAGDMEGAIDRVARYFLYAVFALSVDLIWGFGGLFTFGHAAFFDPNIAFVTGPNGEVIEFLQSGQI